MIVLGDLHLTRFTKAKVGLAFADLCERHPDEPIVVAGDFFDLSTDAPRAERAAAIDAYREAVRLAVRVHDLPAVRAALARIALVEEEGVAGPHVDEAFAQLNMAGGLKR